jgi:hypothetical protein
MKRKSSKFPIGATWKASNDKGQIGEIYLSEINKYFEVWRYSVCYSDGSSHFGDSDWGTSKEMCRKYIPIWNSNGKPLRFKRIK